MKLKWYIYSRLQIILKELDSTKNDEIVKILTNILAEDYSPRDLEKAILTLEKSLNIHIKNGNFTPEILNAIAILGFIYQEGLVVKPDTQQALNFYKLTATQGNPFGQYFLARNHRNSSGSSEENKKAFSLLQLSAKQGLSLAMTELGLCYEEGTGVEKNTEAAIKCYERAAEKGNPVAQYYMGLVLSHSHSSSVKKDVNKAIEYYKLAAQQNYATACFELYDIFENINQDFNVEKDKKQSLEYLQQAVNRGLSSAQCVMGSILLEQGPGQDIKKGIELIEMAANQNYEVALSVLGQFHITGEYIKEDYKYAFELLSKTCKSCSASAYILGGLHDDALGVKKDLDRAALLYQEVIINGNLEDSAREICEQSLTKIRKIKRDLPLLKDACNFYKNNPKMLGFCHQFGLGTKRDLKMAVKCYLEAIERNTACYWDLLICYKCMSEGELDRTTMLEFEKHLKRVVESSPLTHMKVDAANCLAYIYERGVTPCGSETPYIDQNLHNAYKYYGMLKTFGIDCHGKEEQNKPLIAYNKSLKKIFETVTEAFPEEFPEEFPNAVVDLFSEYSYDFTKSASATASTSK